MQQTHPSGALASLFILPFILVAATEPTRLIVSLCEDTSCCWGAVLLVEVLQLEVLQVEVLQVEVTSPFN